MDFSKLTAAELIAGLSRGDFDTDQPAAFFLDRIARSKQLNAFVVRGDSPTADTILAERKVQQKETAEDRGALFGLPVAIKDGICTADHPTTAGSKMLGGYLPPYDATCIEQLHAAGAWTIGKTNMDEFAMGSSTENSAWGPTRNPFDLSRVPGGSSGGSAVAVAAGLAPCALGSDTGGSIRQPAAFCGITGLKPTYGCVSRRGLIAFASSLDQIGPMARTAGDCALLMNALAGHDPLDSTSNRRPKEDYLRGLGGSIDGLKVGVCREHFSAGLAPAVAKSVEASLEFFKSNGATLVDIELPHASLAVATYYVIAPCEASSNLSRYDGVRYTYRHSDESLEAMYCQSRGEGFGAEVARRILLGTFALSSGYYDAYYLQASKVRRLIKNDFDAAFQQVDLIAGPTTPTTAFPLGANADDPLAMYLADIYTVSANLAGIPAISLPCGFDSDGLPIGLQLQGKPFDESTLLSVADFFQQQTDYHQQRPNEAWLESEASS